MVSGLFEMRRPASRSSRDQQDPSVGGFTSDFERPNPSPLTALQHNHIHERVIFVAFPGVKSNRSDARERAKSDRGSSTLSR